MKHDETNQSSDIESFERRLGQQPLRRIPSAWREEILRAAAVPAPRKEPHVSRFTFHALLNRLFCPHPKAWAGLAAVWVLIAGLHFSSQETSPVRQSRASLPPASQMRMALRQKELLFADLIERTELPKAEPPKNNSPRPHSQRRAEIQTV